MIESIGAIIRGRYEAAQAIFTAAASQANTGVVRELAETLGLMSVKLEAREMALENQLEIIQQQNREMQETAKIRAESSMMLCCFLLFLPFYGTAILTAQSFGVLTPQRASTIGIITLLLLFAQIFVFMYIYRRPLSAWGMTWKGGKRAVVESIAVMIPLGAMAIGLKVWLTGIPGSDFYGQPVFMSPATFPWQANLAYAIISVIQEILTRGFLLTNLERILTGKHRSLMAVLTSSVLFAYVHMHYSLLIMAAIFISSLVFGVLYLRHRNVVGVSIAHYLLGFLLMDILGIF